MLVRRVYDIGIQTYTAWRQDRTLRLGAGLAYYTLFTIVPLLALTAALAEWLFGANDMQQYLAGRLAQLGIVDAATASEALASELNRNDVQSTLGLVGLASLFFAASLVFLAFVDAVNVIWKVPVGRGMWHSVRRRLIAFTMVLVTGGVLIAGFAVSAVAGAARALFPGSPELFVNLADPLASLASWASLTVALGMLFRFLPPVRVPWRGALLAGFSTTVLMALGTVAIGAYLRNFGGASVAGAFGAVLATLTWIYYEAQILLGGIQLVRVLTNDEPALDTGPST